MIIYTPYPPHACELSFRELGTYDYTDPPTTGTLEVCNICYKPWIFEKESERFGIYRELRSWPHDKEQRKAYKRYLFIKTL